MSPQVLSLAEAGYKEITLLGQNIDAYGRDLPGRADDGSGRCRVRAGKGGVLVGGCGFPLSTFRLRPAIFRKNNVSDLLLPLADVPAFPTSFYLRAPLKMR